MEETGRCPGSLTWKNPMKVSKQKSRLGEATEQVSVAGLEKKNRDKVNKEQIQRFSKILKYKR